MLSFCWASLFHRLLLSFIWKDFSRYFFKFYILFLSFEPPITFLDILVLFHKSWIHYFSSLFAVFPFFLFVLWFDFFPSPSQLASLEEESQTVVTALERKDKLNTLECIFLMLLLQVLHDCIKFLLDFDNEKQTIQ